MLYLNVKYKKFQEKSRSCPKTTLPYLLQHAYNPADGFPWSDEAFEIAKRDNKPIF
ncbi:DUF255 domain-containing protein [Paenibacillus sp. EPM92]|uniref:DUF255 domain-containing protein n=1 Tax=Paenibacillus sp. EPM92 TaxID=1561195 RepID=UPI0022AA2FF8|nr:DUF255 domain-containing protein [Paenibacillus sp. EPM92]